MLYGIYDKKSLTKYLYTVNSQFNEPLYNRL